MAWCPFAVHKPLSENHTQGRITPRAVILHTAVSGADSLFEFFQHNSNLESHFYVNEAGRIEQYMDTEIMADANKNANSFAVSIETEDGRQIKPWTPAQLDALVRLVTWICDTHGIPKRQIPSAYGSGIGWHVQFGAPGPWTPVAKSCPGQPRIEQTRNVLIPRVARGATGGGAPSPARPNYARRYRNANPEELTLELAPGRHSRYLVVPDGAKEVLLAPDVGEMAVRLQWHGPEYPKGTNVFPKDGLPTADWIAEDDVHMEIHRMRPYRVKVPKGAVGVRVHWTYRLPEGTDRDSYAGGLGWRFDD